jgi:hypothetical protein
MHTRGQGYGQPHWQSYRPPSADAVAAVRVIIGEDTSCAKTSPDAETRRHRRGRTTSVPPPLPCRPSLLIGFRHPPGVRQEISSVSAGHLPVR